MLLLVAGGLLATGCLHGRRKAPAPAGDGQPEKGDVHPEKKDGWAQRVLREPRWGSPFLLIIIPFVFLQLRPEATKALLKHNQDWLLSHALQLMATIAFLLGAYLAISGLVRLT